MRNLFLFVPAFFLVFTACSPRIGSVITKTYPAMENNEPVEVFVYSTAVPSNSESLGVVNITDSGFSTHCDSLTVVEKLKQEARKIGGNAVLITEYVKPSFWGSNCHQMTATILRVFDFQSADRETGSDAPQFVNVKTVRPERMLPSKTLAANAGYGRRTATLNPDLVGFEREYIKGLMSGFAGDVSFNYYFSDYWGLGVIGSAFFASQNMYASSNSGEGNLQTNDIIYFAGPALLLRMPLRNEKWTLICNWGAGYAGYTSKSTFLNDRSKMQGATFGSYGAFGVEYKIEKNLAIGLNCSSISGVLGSWTVTTNGYKESYRTNNAKEKESLNQIQVLLGIRYYMK